MLSYDPEGSKENNVEAMTGALDQVDTMQITYAARDRTLTAIRFIRAITWPCMASLSLPPPGI